MASCRCVIPWPEWPLTEPAGTCPPDACHASQTVKTQMAVTLREGLHTCVANGRVVLLDIDNDRYFALSTDLETTFRGLATGMSEDHLPAAHIQRLRDQNVIVQTNAGASFPVAPSIARPSQSYFDQSAGPVNPVTFLSALIKQHRARRQPNPLSIVDALLSVRSTTQAGPQPGYRVTKAMMNRLHAYLATRRLIGTRDQCLFQSLTLFHFLARHGWYPKLVIAVKMSPFGAHAWLQEGDAVLNDQLDQVLPFTPILVI